MYTYTHRYIDIQIYIYIYVYVCSHLPVFNYLFSQKCMHIDVFYALVYGSKQLRIQFWGMLEVSDAIALLGMWDHELGKY